MNKKVILPMLVVVVGGAVSVLIATAKPEPQPRSPIVQAAPQVEVLELKAQRASIKVRSQGTVSARRRIDLTAQVGGVIRWTDEQFADGGQFTTGQVLLRVDDRDYEIALVRARAALAQAQAQLATEKGLARQAKAEWRDLGSAEANDLFLRKSQLAAAQAQLEAAQADLEQARLNLQRTAIQAPFPGRVVQILVNQGQFISAGTPVATVYDNTSLQVGLPVSSRELSLLKLNQPMPVTLMAQTGGEQKRWPAMIQRRAATINDGTQQITLFADLPVEEGAPVVGQFVQADIQGVELDGVFIIPRQALRAGDQVWTVSAEQKLQIQTVEVLRAEGETFKVRGGLSNPLQLVVSYLAKPQAGLQVDVLPTHGGGPS